MSAQVTVEQTTGGWRIVATDVDEVFVETSGNAVSVAIHPDEDEGNGHGKPLAVSLSEGQSAQ